MMYKLLITWMILLISSSNPSAQFFDEIAKEETLVAIELKDNGEIEISLQLLDESF